MNMLQSILAASEKTYWLPRGTSSVSGDVDWLYYFVYWVNVFFFLLVVALMIWFGWKYRHRGTSKPVESSSGHSTALELTWTIIPTLIVIVIFYYGFRGFLAMAVEPPQAYEITVNGKTWSWSFQYPNGYVSDKLHVPADTPIRFVLTSDDVLHSLFVPDWRIKKDVVPGRYNRLWVQAEKINPDPKVYDEHDVYCAEYCGTNHSAMITTAYVHDKNEFPQWLESVSNWETTMSPIEAGKQLYTQRGCAQCHSTDGSITMGPTWLDLFGNDIDLADGSTVVADEAYIRESILYPQAKLHKGFGAVMPSYLGSMKERDINAMIAYMKSISEFFPKDQLTPLSKPADAPSPEGAKIAK